MTDAIHVRCLDDGQACEVIRDSGPDRSSVHVFDALWLRDNAPRHRDPDNGQRLIDVLDLPDDPRIAAVRIEPFEENLDGVNVDRSRRGTLVVRWSDLEEPDRYRLEDLFEQRPDDREPDRWEAYPGGPQVLLWRAADAGCWPVLDERRFLDDPKGRGAWLTGWAECGVALLTDVRPEPGRVLELAERLGYVRQTNYGRLFDVRAVDRPNNLAYSDRGLAPHTDNPYRDPVPGVQLLHCLRPASEGGRTRLVDGFAAAEHLRTIDPEGFQILATTPVRFRFRDAHAELIAEAPLIELDVRDRVRTIRYNNRSMEPVRRPTSEIRPFYRAWATWASLLQSPEFVAEHRLEAGELLVLDNRRVLHGRTAVIDPERRRHLQGAYIDRDGLMSTLQLLRRDLEHPTSQDKELKIDRL